jgi:hypothetical protein
VPYGTDSEYREHTLLNAYEVLFLTNHDETVAMVHNWPNNNLYVPHKYVAYPHKRINCNGGPNWKDKGPPMSSAELKSYHIDMREQSELIIAEEAAVENNMTVLRSASTEHDVCSLKTDQEMSRLQDPKLGSKDTQWNAECTLAQLESIRSQAKGCRFVINKVHYACTVNFVGSVASVTINMEEGLKDSNNIIEYSKDSL